ncbi:hypothetical protein ACJMK2_036290 [Sinanodonta woodiana]|uniref:Uncharacterized protein n=1 Tax=Sinanodonta woodiana TaxID=1069815 RepID=A0ABD3WHX3_SINWO
MKRLECELRNYCKDFETNKDLSSNCKTPETDVVDLVQTGFSGESDILGLDELFVKLKSRPAV